MSVEAILVFVVFAIAAIFFFITGPIMNRILTWEQTRIFDKGKSHKIETLILTLLCFELLVFLIVVDYLSPFFQATFDIMMEVFFPPKVPWMPHIP